MDLAKVELIGRLGNDPDAKFTPDGRAVLSFSLAVGRGKKVDGEWQNETDWYRVTAWGPLAERLGDKVSKGARVYLAGRLSQRSYTDKNGAERTSLDVTANDVIPLDDRGKGGAAPVAAGAQGQSLSDLPF